MRDKQPLTFSLASQFRQRIIGERLHSANARTNKAIGMVKAQITRAERLGNQDILSRPSTQRWMEEADVAERRANVWSYLAAKHGVR